MSRQSEKYHLSLAGEFFVAAELQRRGIAAAVTYGNAKSADVVAFSMAGDRAVVVEVKTTSTQQWVVGGSVPSPSSKPWVFVHIPSNQDDAPTFYVLSQAELHAVLKPIDEAYDKRFLEKHGEPYGDRVAVINLARVHAEPFKNAWTSILGPLSG